MRSLLAPLLPAALLASLPLLACATADGQPEPRPDPDAGPIVVELFTSQGCSSCPPADRYLATLAARGHERGRAVAPLSFHVDYWNDLGWVDPYAHPAWTARQQRYARALGDDRVYTPEVVIGGAAGRIGSRTGEVAAAIAAAPLPARLSATAAWSAGAVDVSADAPANAEVLVAVWEEARTTAVPRGENAGAQLTNHRIVRRLERVAGPGQRGRIRVALDPSWREVGAVAFAQRADQRIVASALLPAMPAMPAK